MKTAAKSKSVYASKALVDKVTDKLYEKMSKSQSQLPQTFAMAYQYQTQSNDAARRVAGPGITFSTLRSMSVNHETTRAAINLRKRQITQLQWDVVDSEPDHGKSYSDEAIYTIRQVLSRIGGPGIRFREILDKIIEDTLVLDAACLYKQKTVGGKLLRLVPIDGATIKLVVDDSGLIARAPDIGFEQWIAGKKTAEMTTDELIYERMNPRTATPYGLSPLESLVVTVDASIKAAMFNTAYLSDGNLPMGFYTVPENWTPQQIQEYKTFFDALMSNPREQAKGVPLPSGSDWKPVTKPTDFQFKEFYDYLDRKVAMLFDVTAQELGLALQQYKENASSQEDIQMRKGLRPLAHFIEDIFTEILEVDMGYPELRFQFMGLESKYTNEDAKELIPLGVISPDDVREDRGEPRLGVDPFVIVGNTIVPLTEINATFSAQNAAPQSNTVSGTNQPVKEQPNDMPTTTQTGKMNGLDNVLSLWEKKSTKDFKLRGKVYRSFEDDSLTKSAKIIIENGLRHVKSLEDVKDVFKRAKLIRQNPIDGLIQDPKFDKFKVAVKKALLKQIKPFTLEDKIASFTKMEKAIGDDVDSEMPQVDIPDLVGYLKWSFGYGASNAARKLGLASFQMTNQKFMDILGDREAYIIDSLDNTTKDWLINTIINGKDQLLTNAEIASQISDEYDAISDERANTIVNTEVANASMQGELQTYDENGITQKVWVTSEDEMTCPDCADMDGEIVNADENFSSGDDAPPLHPNCRCYLNGLLPEEQ